MSTSKSLNASPASLSTSSDLTQTRWNLCICCIILFCAEASRGLFIPSLWSCVQHLGQSHHFLSWCIPIFSVGRMAGSYLAGHASDRWQDDGKPTVACIVAAILGGIIYVTADMTQSWLALLVAQFLMGMGGGTLAVLRAHVSKITTDRERLTHTTYISTAQFAGLGLMPLVALAINSYFVGPQHHEEHALHRESLTAAITVATATAGAFLHAKSSSSPLYHDGLENSARGTHYTQHHASKYMHHSSHRQLLESMQIGQPQLPLPSSNLEVSSALTTIAVSPDTLSTASPSISFSHRFLNHRTAPGHLLILLNVLCLILYFIYFSPGHQSAEYREKKREQEEKRKMKERIAREGGIGEEESGGAFGSDRTNANTEACVDGSSAVFTAATARKKKPAIVKEIVFDVSKLATMSIGGGQTGSQEEMADDAAVQKEDAPLQHDASSAFSPFVSSTSPSSTSASSTAAHPQVSITQDADTTVITLQSDSSLSLTKSHTDDKSALLHGVNTKQKSEARSSSSKASASSSPTSNLSFLRQVAHAVIDLFRPSSKTASINANGKNVSTSSSSSLSSSQSSRIASYTTTRPRLVDIDDIDACDGIYLGPLHLTPERMIMWGSCLFVFLNYTIRGVLATVETIGTPTLAHFEHIPAGSPLEIETSAKFFGVLGLLGCVVFLMQWYYQDLIDEPTILISGFVVSLVGSSVIAVSSSESSFLFGCVCIWSYGLPAVQNSVISALSRILGTRPQGTWMGWIQTFGSLGRVTFPLIIKLTNVTFAFVLSSFGCGIAIVALMIYMKLVKMTM